SAVIVGVACLTIRVMLFLRRVEIEEDVFKFSVQTIAKDLEIDEFLLKQTMMYISGNLSVTLRVDMQFSHFFLFMG
ncbi:MAG: hypothetical protein K2L92_04785, partial [Muribaculaceae bacterium]|nr:hypothetical protein [Muribaculaceae bacterium]